MRTEHRHAIHEYFTADQDEHIVEKSLITALRRAIICYFWLRIGGEMPRRTS